MPILTGFQARAVFEAEIGVSAVTVPPSMPWLKPAHSAVPSVRVAPASGFSRLGSETVFALSSAVPEPE